jgi:hypothetical protein
MMSNFAFADCKPAVRLNVGDKVTDCPRIGLSEDADKQIRIDLIEGDFNKKIVEEQKRQIDLKDLMITDLRTQKDLWRDDAMREREYADSQRAKSDRNFWIGFGIGILSVVAAGYAIGQVSK